MARLRRASQTNTSLTGWWATGVVRGRLINKGWAAAGGYPALTLEAEAEDIDVQMFSSLDLPAHWSRLDAFEGEDYCRVTVAVAIGDALVEAWIYVAAA